MNEFEPVQRVARVMESFRYPWFISGGWSIDLLIGKVTRDHEDVEVGILRRHQLAVRKHLKDWLLDKAVTRRNGRPAWVPWDEGEWLQLPIHQVKAEQRQSEKWEFELFLNDAGRDVWRFRRNPRIRFPLREVAVPSKLGVPIIAPQLELLHKATVGRNKPGQLRPKDELDLENALPFLTPGQKDWLRESVATCYPGHPWLDRL